MSKVDSNGDAARGKCQKPNKPNPNFPLFAHMAGVGQEDPRQAPLFQAVGRFDGSLAKYHKQRDALETVRKPREDTEGFIVKELCNRFLNAKPS